MLRLSLQCTDCGYEEENIDLTNDDMLDGQCPICKNHHGNVVYFTDMKVDEFIEELAKMDLINIAKQAIAINLIAEDLYYNK